MQRRGHDIVFVSMAFPIRDYMRLLPLWCNMWVANAYPLFGYVSIFFRWPFGPPSKPCMLTSVSLIRQYARPTYCSILVGIIFIEEPGSNWMRGMLTSYAYPVKYCGRLCPVFVNSRSSSSNVIGTRSWVLVMAHSFLASLKACYTWRTCHLLAGSSISLRIVVNLSWRTYPISTGPIRTPLPAPLLNGRLDCSYMDPLSGFLMTMMEN